MSVGALLIVSAISLLVCYYVLAKFGHMGNFLNLPLPWLPPAKDAHAAISHPPISHVVQTMGQWLVYWS